MFSSTQISPSQGFGVRIIKELHKIKTTDALLVIFTVTLKYL